MRVRPQDATAFYNRGFTYLMMEEHDSAIADFNEALDRAPRNPAIYVSRGNAFLGKGEPVRALADYNDALRVDPEYAPTYAARERAEDAIRRRDGR